MENEFGVVESKRHLQVVSRPLNVVEGVQDSTDADLKFAEYGKEVRRAYRVIKDQLIHLKELRDSKDPGSEEHGQISSIIEQLQQEEERLGRYLNFYVKHRVDSIVQEFRSGLEKSKPAMRVSR